MPVRTERGAQIVLAVLVVTLAWLAYRAWAPTAATSAGASNAMGGRPGAAGPPAAVAPDVQLEMLGRDRVQPEKASRNPFKFQTRVEAAPPQAASTPRAAAPAPSGPPAAPAVPPIALKFIGVVEPDGKGPRIAVLSDSRGVVHGREGEVVLGQYRILRIGPDSIDIVHLDGRGRQTIRLNGS
jgi:hypothetical protein